MKLHEDLRRNDIYDGYCRAYLSNIKYLKRARRAVVKGDSPHPATFTLTVLDEMINEVKGNMIAFFARLHAKNIRDNLT